MTSSESFPELSTPTSSSSASTRSLSEDKDHKYQWAESSNVNTEDGWNYCGPDTGGTKWYRRSWPVKDPENPLRVEEDHLLLYQFVCYQLSINK